MSRRDPGARHGARHARERLQSALGEGTGLLADGGGKVFEYDGGAQDGGAGPVSGSGDHNAAGAGRAGPALRFRVGLPVALLIAALAVAAGAWFWTQVAAGQPHVLPLSEVTEQESGPSVDGETPGQGTDRAGPPDMPPESPHAGTVIIHVAGAVALPGVVQLPAGSRVHQAIAEAGGGTPSADLNRLNLAAVLEDGQKLYVPVPGEDLPAAPGGSGSEAEDPGGGAASDGAKVNLNSASVEELDALPKVGPVLAQRIVDWRKEHGLFKSVEELDAVDGVGPKMLETLLPLVGI